MCFINTILSGSQSSIKMIHFIILAAVRKDYRLGRCRIIAVWTESVCVCVWGGGGGGTIFNPSVEKHGVDPEWST